MKRLFTGCEEQVAPFMDEYCHSHGAFLAGRAIAQVECDDENKTAELLAGVWFEGFNGANINIHVAAKPKSNWLNRELLWFSFHYAFNQCGAKRVTAWVDEMNHESRRLVEGLGFEYETRLKDASPYGDGLAYVMRKDTCKWLHQRRAKVKEH